MSTFLTPSGPIEIAPGRGDLRYGSVRSQLPAAPSWYGLHDGSFSFNVGPLDGKSFAPNGSVISFERLYTGHGTVHAVIKKFLDLARLCPLKVYKRGSDGNRSRLRAADSPLAASIDSPWPGGSSGDLLEAMLGSLLVQGNSLIAFDGSSFRKLDWRFITPQQVSRDRVSGWLYSDEDFEEERLYVPGEVIHTAFYSPCGPIGVSPLSALGTTLTIDVALQDHQANTWRNGARPPSAIQMDTAVYGSLTADQKDALLASLRDQITTIHAGSANAGKPAILPPGLTWNQVGHTAVEAELIETRRLAMETVASVYGMPQPSVGQLENATYSNIATQKQQTYQEALAPILVRLTSALNTSLVRDRLGLTDVYVECDLDGLLQGNPEDRIEQLTTAVQGGGMTINEMRERLNLPRSDSAHADDLLIAANNYKPLGQLDEPDAT